MCVVDFLQGTNFLNEMKYFNPDYFSKDSLQFCLLHCPVILT